MSIQLTPKQIVEHLDRYVIGQRDAKKAVAVALRNRYRRSLLDQGMREDIVPKNILMIGPTGVGKTEIARRLAKIVGAPFIKVEATKFTEVGYVGRDVEAMVRDLVEVAIRIVKDERLSAVQEQAEAEAEKRIADLLVPGGKATEETKNPFEMLFSNAQKRQEPIDPKKAEEREAQVRETLWRVRAKSNEEMKVTIEVEESQSGLLGSLNNPALEQMGMNIGDALEGMMPKKRKKRRVTVAEARKILTNEEAMKLIDLDEVTQEAVYRAEELGIIFIDEMDKIASKRENGAQVSREGVQRDILPIVEGSTVMTKYGPVRTDYMLFIAAGAFHISKPSDLIPELQGRFPIRVELEKLSVDDFINILTQPKNALTKQYCALLATEGIEIEISDEAIVRIANIAYELNQETDNIGARRLHTILEKLFEDISFEASEIAMGKIPITENYVDQKLGAIVRNKDLSHYIL
ncbi:MAG: ATP-dependent protease ATPase subunit HslU [Bacilli bacterium]